MTTIVSPAVGRVDAGAAPRKLARLAAHFMADERNDEPLILAVRLGIDQLFRRESDERRRHLLFVADALATLRTRQHLHDDDEALIDLVRAECLARAGETARAKLVVDDRRRRIERPDLRAALEAIESELAN